MQKSLLFPFSIPLYFLVAVTRSASHASSRTVNFAHQPATSGYPHCVLNPPTKNTSASRLLSLADHRLRRLLPVPSDTDTRLAAGISMRKSPCKVSKLHDLMGGLAGQSG